MLGDELPAVCCCGLLGECCTCILLLLPLASLVVELLCARKFCMSCSRVTCVGNWVVRGTVSTVCIWTPAIGN